MCIRDRSTFLKLLGMIERPTSGTIYFDGMDTEDLWKDELADIRRRRIGFVFQDFYLLDSLCIKDNILLPMILDKAESKSMVEKAEGLAELFGIKDLLPKAPYELSGGEKQRAAICRAPVSYTHLDVYKRQFLQRIKIGIYPNFSILNGKLFHTLVHLFFQFRPCGGQNLATAE